MNDSTSAAIGNIEKNGNTFIHNYGTDNTFVGVNAGNFTLAGGTLNTGVGVNSLNTIDTGIRNTAMGVNSLQSTTDGNDNTGIGYAALRINTTGSRNTAVGYTALEFNTIGIENTAMGWLALNDNTTGSNNVVIGAGALAQNTTGSNNVVIGRNAMAQNNGANNTVLGANAAPLLTGGIQNVMIGSGISSLAASGDNNIYIDGSGLSPASESDTIRIGNTQTTCFVQGIFGATSIGGTAVVVNAAGQLGTLVSSKRFKHDISEMDNASSRIFDLNPVTFVYNGDTNRETQYGLIAEDVAQVFPNLVVEDSNGEAMAVRYEVLPVLLLNEVQKLKVAFDNEQLENQNTRIIVEQLVDRVNTIENSAQ